MTVVLEKKATLNPFISGDENADPDTPASNKGRLYFRANTAGKTQLCVMTDDGVVGVLWTQT